MKLKATGVLKPEVVAAVLPIVPLLKAVVREHYDWLQLTHEFYSVMGSSMDLSTMQKNQFNDMLGDCNILDKRLKRLQVLVYLFTTANNKLT